MTKTLVAKDVHQHFGGVQALRGVSLSVREGQVVGLIGPNGSGKSTFLSVLAGVQKPAQGSVTLDGRRIDGLPAPQVVGLGVAKTHQIPRPFLEMTAAENVASALLYGSRRLADPGQALAEATRVLGLVGLEGQAGVTGAALTVQQRKRLELARVIATGARILLLDEIFAGLNPDELRAAIDLFASIQKQLGFGALVVEHVMPAVLTLSDHIVVLVEGQVIAEGKPQDVVHNAAVIEAYLGKEAVDAPA